MRKAYVVMESSGEYEERWDRAHSVYAEEKAADAECDRLNAAAPRKTYRNGKVYQETEYDVEVVDFIE